MTTLSWLHLSDWHQRGTDFDRTVVRDALLDDIKGRASIAPALADIRFVIFSGDIAFAGKQAEYDAAKEHLLEPMRACLGIEARDFFLIPGNHDLDRDEVIKFAPQVLRKPLTEPETKEWLTDSRMRERILEPFGAFIKFAAAYSGQADAVFASRRDFDVGGRRVALLGLNSALMCGRRFDEKGEVNDLGVLTLGEPQFHDGLRSIADADLRICILHHPFEWLHDYDRARLEPALFQTADAILTGHVHRPGISVAKHSQGTTVLVPAGSSYDRREPTAGSAYANAYNFVSLDLATGKAEIYLRRWDGQNSRWVEDHASSKDGCFAFKVPRLKPARGSRGPRVQAVPLAERQAAAAATYRRRLLESCDLMETANLPSDHLVAQRELHLRQLFIPTRVIFGPTEPEANAGSAERNSYLPLPSSKPRQRDEFGGSAFAGAFDLPPFWWTRVTAYAAAASCSFCIGVM
jgi:3',5'-cyclic AMP phosphodiesterase CpdA